MTVEFEVEEDGDSTRYHAVLSEIAGDGRRTPTWRAQIWVHPPKVREDIGRPLEGVVFFHPSSQFTLELSRFLKGLILPKIGSSDLLGISFLPSFLLITSEKSALQGNLSSYVNFCQTLIRYIFFVRNGF